MKNVARKFVVWLLTQFHLYSVFKLRSSGPIKEDGWFRSFEEGASVNNDGDPIPWFTYPAYEFIKRRINKEMSVFEYGCGASTLWWASEVKLVVSCEHDKQWYENIHSKIPENVNLIYAELEYGGDYSKKISEYERNFDVLVIDGRDRVNCALNSLQALKLEGVIIWDNSDREEYREGYDFLRINGFKKLEFVGLTPIVSFKTETGIFYRPNNCLGI